MRRSMQEVGSQEPRVRARAARAIHIVMLVALALGMTPVAATPAPKQLLWRFDGDKLNQLQGTSIANAGDVDGDGTADVITGLFTAATAALGNKVAARVYSGRTGALLQSVSAPLPQSHASANLV